MKQMTIYLDFDGTVVAHEYPAIGIANPNAVKVIKKLQDAGHNIILNTMRAEFNDGTLERALEYLNSNKEVSGINITRITNQKIVPPKWNPKEWEDEIYIDDIAPDILLIVAEQGFIIDWVKIENQLVESGILEAAFNA